MYEITLHSVNNTPGFLYAVSYWLGMLICVLSSPQRRSWKVVVPVNAGILAALFWFMVTTDGIPAVYFFPAMSVSICLLVADMYLSCRIRFREALFFTCHGFMMGEFMTSLGWQLLYYRFVGNGRHLDVLTVCRYMAPIYAGMLAVGLLCGYVLRHQYKDLDLSWNETLTLVVITAIMYAISNSSYALGQTPFTSTLPWAIFIIRTITDLCGVALCLVYTMLVFQMNARIQAESMNRLLEMQYANYKVQRDSVDLINQKYHDLKHQIAILRNGLDEQDHDSRQQYLNEVEAQIRDYEAQNKTGNKVLDTILTSHSLTCQKKGITMTVVADGKALDFMSPFDLAALFGNALDNAIESVVKIEAPEERLIHVQVSRQRSFVHISVANRYQGEIRFLGGVPVTSKSDNRYHGFGVRSIRQTAEKYNGSATVATKEGWFYLNVLLPVTEAPRTEIGGTQRGKSS